MPGMAPSSLRDITVIVDLNGERRAVTLAAELARASGAHLTGVSTAFDPLVPVYTASAPLPTEFIVAAHEQAVADAKAAADAFAGMAANAGVTAETRIVESISGDGLASVVRNCILTDLAVVGQDNPDHPEPVRAALIEALLFQAGLPVLLVPYSGAATLSADRAVIGWNGSAAAGRSVRAAMPMLSQAKNVVVVVVDEGGRMSGEAGADLGAYLARHDIDVSVRIVPAGSGGAGATLLDFAVADGAGWLVMGAYGHSRIREFLLGGVTRHILATATLPVLMSH